ncbi:hypothetical protein IA539_03935 [Gordonia sp. zg691]|nr:hypothetical protein [Gordonia jinghuaiqii]
MSGRLAAVLLVNDVLDEQCALALESYCGIVGGLLESRALRGRHHQQTEMLSAVTSLQHTSVDDVAEAVRETTEKVKADLPLTVREREVFELLVTGMSNRGIADHLVLSVETVRSHVKRLLRKAGAANRAELISSMDSRLRADQLL